MLTILGLFAIQYVNIPYLYGGENVLVGIDCSSLVQHILRHVKLDPKGDQTAQMLYNHFSKKNLTSEIKEDSLLFYGKSLDKIGHIALALTDTIMIEAAGGDSTTRTKEDAIKRQARVRIVPIRNKNLVAAIKLQY